MLERQGERRRFIRMQARCKMTYRFPQSPETFEATCHNLSGAGVMFTSSRPIEPGNALEIKITPVTSATPPLEAFVEVLRVEERDGEYEIAAEIKGIKG
ncbi:PilZ domain-containing protein [Methylohalobius crimeensis]|uniref:PilZ domain-containing protein n=1 Tax=Methylohalobius crimeensis TaxID=244365 RepID=UPI0003B38D9E|nr:PilZ domain-containing protein [Methylohalobius crimeensis]